MSKNVARLTYGDLSFPSKFFYSDGIEDVESIFPDETKQSPQVSNKLEGCPVQQYIPNQFENVDKQAEFIVMYPTLKLLDKKTAIEAACGDAKFLVSSKALLVFEEFFFDFI